MTLPILHSELCIQMCNLAHLHLKKVDLSKWFIEPDIRKPNTFEDLLPRLYSILINKPHPSGSDWTPLTNFLTRHAATGKQITSLRLSDYPPMHEAVTESLKHVVEFFEDESSDDDDYY